jgi:hypothetical protein
MRVLVVDITDVAVVDMLVLMWEAVNIQVLEVQGEQVVDKLMLEVDSQLVVELVACNSPVVEHTHLRVELQSIHQAELHKPQKVLNCNLERDSLLVVADHRHLLEGGYYKKQMDDGRYTDKRDFYFCFAVKTERNPWRS